MEFLNSAWELITRKDVGLLAIAVALAGLAKALYEIRKLHRETAKLQNDLAERAKKLPLELAKLTYEAEQSQRQLLQLKGHQKEVLECVSAMAQNVNLLWNSLYDAFQPILAGPLQNDDVKIVLANVKSFAHKQEYRPLIDQAKERLHALTAKHKVPIINELLDQVGEFCRRSQRRFVFPWPNQ